MPTPACLATAVIGAPGSATKTARADSRMRWSLRAAAARTVAVRAARLGLGHGKSVAEDWNEAFRSDSLGTEDFVPIVHGRIGCHQQSRPRSPPQRRAREGRSGGGGGAGWPSRW